MDEERRKSVRIKKFITVKYSYGDSKNGKKWDFPSIRDISETGMSITTQQQLLQDDIITFLVIFYKIHPGDKTIALHYNVVAGVEWYGKSSNLYFIPGTGLIITFVNFILYNVLKKTDYFLDFLIIFATACVQAVLLFAVLLLAK